MRSIKRRFVEKVRENAGVSSFIAFARAIKGQKFTRGRINKQFSILVEKDDYLMTEKKALIDYLYYFSNTPEEKLFKAKFAPGEEILEDMENIA